MSISDSIRRQLVMLARRKGTRTSAFTSTRPKDWRPGDVPNPSGLLLPYFDDQSAWELIASRLEGGHDVETVVLDQPPGKTAYVLKIELNPERPLLYVKIELRSGEVVGRSFHESERKRG